MLMILNLNFETIVSDYGFELKFNVVIISYGFYIYLFFGKFSCFI